MEKLFALIKDQIATGQDLMLISVVDDKGSAPRGAGARMLYNQNGRLYGTIGGGGIEFKAGELALIALAEKKSYLKPFQLSPNQVEDLGMVCGGNVLVYFQYIAHNQPGLVEFCQKIVQSLQQGRDLWLITCLNQNWQMGLYSKEDGLSGLDLDAQALSRQISYQPQKVEINNIPYYIEPLRQPGRVLIFGGGHIAQELVPVLANLSFDCLVIDDRPEFTAKEIFPQAKQLICGDLNDIEQLITIDSSDYLIIMTRGHSFDYIIQKQAMQKDCQYIGVIGSRAKIATINKKLLAEGFSQEQLASIYTPIGLPIKAETPAEIAISIAAQLILIRAEAKK